MSTAQTIREAAVTWPMPELNETEWRAVHLFLGPYEFIFHTGGTEHRLFMLLVADSLDGGVRLPMSKQRMKTLVWTRSPLLLMVDVVRAVEQHHGIGVKP